MVTKKTNTMTPHKLRLILIGSIAVMIIGAGGLFWVFREQVLIPKAKEVADVSISAQSKDNEVNRLKATKAALERDKDTVDKAAKIVADTRFYQYQDQIIKDLTAYAKATGVIIRQYDFSNGNGAGSGATTAQPAVSADPNGLKSIGVAISLQNPVPYVNLMRFIHAIEINLTKMQLAGIAISKDPSNAITANTLTIKVFTK